MVAKVKGVQDFLNLTEYNFVIDQLKKHLDVYNFTEIVTPILEPTILFQRSLGTTTDVVTKEMFVIDNEKKDICLRPEGTASIMRAFLENTALAMTIPWKVFTYGPMFRHERPQKGRFRQFHQMSIEVIGSESVSQDVQLIKMLDRFFDEKIQIIDYGLMINFLGCAEDRVRYSQQLHEFLKNHLSDICGTCQVRAEKNSLRVFDCKNGTCQVIYQDAPPIMGSWCTDCTVEWQQVQNQLSLLSVSFIHNPRLVRGLDYYNKTVFEFVSNALGSQSAFCAGGRYDMLATLLGAKKDYPSVGVAIGIERLIMLLQESSKLVVSENKRALHVIIPLFPDQQALALLLADTLQAAGLATDVLLSGGSVKSMMRKADKMTTSYTLLLGQDEQDTAQVTIKNMLTGQESRVAQVDAVAFLTSKK